MHGLIIDNHIDSTAFSLAVQTENLTIAGNFIIFRLHNILTDD